MFPGDSYNLSAKIGPESVVSPYAHRTKSLEQFVLCVSYTNQLLDRSFFCGVAPY
jgi:hypothetical protein